jgi:glycosyltransferase involved in cell wall biosynthesis
MPKFSIIVPLYNKVNHISRAIDSVLNQSFSDFELIVVNDGSTDGGEIVVSKYTDCRVVLINQANSGESAARNTGISKSNARYVTFLDADDAYDSDFLEIINKLVIDFPGAAAYATHARDSAISQSQKSLMNDPDRVENCWMIENYFECLNKGYFPVTSSSVCVKKQVLIKIKGFDEKLKIGADIDAWIRIFLTSGIALSNRYGATYHTDAENRSIHRPDVLFRELEFFEHLRDTYLNINLNNRSYSALSEWTSNRIHQILIRLINHGNKRLAAKVFCSHWQDFSGRQCFSSLVRLSTPNSLVRFTKLAREILI